MSQLNNELIVTRQRQSALVSAVASQRAEVRSAARVRRSRTPRPHPSDLAASARGVEPTSRLRFWDASVAGLPRWRS